MKLMPSDCYSICLRLEYKQQTAINGVLLEIDNVGGDLFSLINLAADQGKHLWELKIRASSLAHQKEIVNAIRKIDSIKVVSVEDITFAIHRCGKITVENKMPLNSRAAMSMAYTPGVGRVCMAIHDDVERAYSLTIKRNIIAVVSDGTAVLGLGDIGPEAAMPVMEGKAMLFKGFGGVDAFPVCINTKDQDEIVTFVKQIAPTFGGINLEDISAPRCFYIEDKLKAELDIPVFHDDQHGTAIVVLAALINSLKIVNKKVGDIKVVISGVGAAGVACTKILQVAGVNHIIGCDRAGAIYKGRTENMNWMKNWFAEHTNEERFQGNLTDALKGADLFLGLSGPGLLHADEIKLMNKDALVFAMSNPVPEIMPEEAGPYVAIMATGRSDYPNQINNVLAFPGIFKGALQCQARAITEDMKLAAAEGIAACVSASQLNPQYIIPNVFDPNVAITVAKAVEEVAIRDGIARLITAEPPAFDTMTR